MPAIKDEGKTPVVSTIIAALCVMLYIGGLSYGALSIYNSVIERRALADKEFDSLADLVSATGVLGFMDEPFIKTVQDSIDGSQTVLGVVITSSRGEFAFERERGTVIAWVNDSPRFIPRFAVSNPPKYLPLRIEGQRNVNIQAVCGYVDYDYCIGILKRTLLVVLFSLALAFFTLLMDTLLVKNREPREVPQSPAPGNSGKAPEPPRADAHEEAPDTPETAESWMPPDDDDEDDMPDFDGDGDEAPGFDFNGGGDEPDFDADDEAPDFDDGPAPQERAAPQESAAPGERAAGDTPQGLFSPRGGIGWNAYTEERLESELHRCASTEQDLALILAEIKEPENIKAELFRLFCQEAVLYFEHRDLIFENGDQGISVICPGFGLEQAFTKSEEFNNRVLGKLAQASGAKTDLRFGISSRAGRLIDAGRIALEAGEALKRASGDPASHIVAFKSDPEKYRQHVAGRRP